MLACVLLLGLLFRVTGKDRSVITGLGSTKVVVQVVFP